MSSGLQVAHYGKEGDRCEDGSLERCFHSLQNRLSVELIVFHLPMRQSAGGRGQLFLDFTLRIRAGEILQIVAGAIPIRVGFRRLCHRTCSTLRRTGEEEIQPGGVILPGTQKAL
jgi:hypothetical protein